MRSLNKKEVMNFLYWEQASEDTIDFKRIYVDVAGDILAGLLLSQIIYWHLPNKSGEQKLRVEKDGHLWIAKGRSEWFEEIRLTARQFDRASKILEDKGLIEKKKFKFGGSPTIHTRLIWEKFLPMLNDVIFKDESNEKGSTNVDDTGINENVNSNSPIREMDFNEGVNSNSPNREMDFNETLRTITKNTTENTTENTTTNTESDVAEIIQFWDSNGFGINNTFGKESLLLFLNDDDFKNPKQMILEAMKIACGNNKRTGRYVEGVLKNWINQDIRSVEDINQHRFREYENEEQHSGKEVLPDWFKERDQENPTKKADSIKESEVDIQKEKEKMQAFIEKYARNGYVGS